MIRDPLFHVDEMLCHARDAQMFVEGMTEQAFALDTRSQYAVKYAMHVIGEAASKVPPEFRQRFAHVPWQQMIAMRDRLAHDGLGTRIDVLFATARNFAPRLVAQLTSIIAELEADTPR